MTGVGGPKHLGGSATAGIRAFVAKMTAVSLKNFKTIWIQYYKLAYFESKCFSPTLPLSVGLVRIFEVVWRSNIKYCPML
jgi:hypothetical protein